MVFSSVTFLLYFLPIVVIVHFLLKNIRLRNLFLLGASLFFYTWGEGPYMIIMVGSIIMNYLLGLWINKEDSKLSIIVGVSANVLLLTYFKYFNFIIQNLMNLEVVDSQQFHFVHLPIGISFFTFQSISYLVDIKRGTSKVQKNIFDLGLYISLFPQLIAGPIVRYNDVDNQIENRTIRVNAFISGINRFIIGLGKKLLLADPLALIADEIFAINPMDIPTEMAWLGILCYTLQIFFDFSGYSDMAIGLGRMFGFSFLENFNFPYISRSIQEFWRRWHISLSNWFRDYLYIPLGGNRKGNVRTYVNLIIVFVVTGIWHGAAWNFLFWGVYHGFFLIIERLGLEKLIKRAPSIVGHIYCLLVVMIGWVFFKAESLEYGIGYVKSMFGVYNGWDYAPLMNLDAYRIMILVLAVILSFPIFYKMDDKLKAYFSTNTVSMANRKKILITKGILFRVSMMIVLFLCLIEVATSSYSPFIYFRF